MKLKSVSNYLFIELPNYYAYINSEGYYDIIYVAIYYNRCL